MKRYAPADRPVKLPGPILLAVATALGLSLAWLAREISGGLLPLDDAYIYLQYANRFAAGHPFQYGAGEPLTTGTTSLAWLLLVTLCTIGASIFSMTPETMVFLFEGVLLGAALWLFLRLAVAEGVPLPAAGSAALLLPCMPLWLFGSLNGMETLLHGAGLLLVIAVLRGASPWWLLVSAFSRPAAVPIVFGAVALLWFRPQAGRRTLVSVAILSLFGVAWPWLLTGQASLTWTAKSLLLEPRPDVRAFYIPKTAYFALRSLWFGVSGAHPQPPLDVIGHLFRTAPWTVWGWAAFHCGGIFLVIGNRRRWTPAILWGIATFECLLTVAWDGQDYRYLVAPLPLLLLASIEGWSSALTGKVRIQVFSASVLLAAMALFPEPAWVRFRDLIRARSRDLALTQKATGAWIDAHLDPAARVAVHDAGAVSFFGRRPIVDLVGLVTPELSLAWRNGEGAVWESLSEIPHPRRPTHAALVVAWIPRLARTGLFDRRLMTTQGEGGRVDFEVWSLSWPDQRAKRLPGPDLSDIPAAFGPGAGQSALEIMDRVDIASLASERAHGCVFTTAGDPHDPLSLVMDLAFEPALVMSRDHALDGGRDLSGSIRFHLRARKGSPALLVIRSASPREARLTARVGDFEDSLVVPRNETQFHEADLLIPEEVLARAIAADGTIEVRIEAERHLVFHWWLLQPVAAATP